MNKLSAKQEECTDYIPATEEEIESMLQAVGCVSFEELFSHLPKAAFMEAFESKLPDRLSPAALKERMLSLASKNAPKLSFIGDALPVYKTLPIVQSVSNVRNLTTAYTPYQPERSQGTLISHWIFQCLMTQLTGFEAVNTSLYDRSTAIFEAIACALRIQNKSSVVVVSENIFPQDRAVLETLLAHTKIKVQWVGVDPLTGLTNCQQLKEHMLSLQGACAGCVFPQVNQLGLLEPVHEITDLIHSFNALAIAVIDPMLLGFGGLIPPSQFGKKGADIFVGEGQSLAIGPNFGGPGLGLFGVRYHANCKNHVRFTPGRFVGKTVDAVGDIAYTMVLSTREQHIRKANATSNICSNQAFLATAAGAALLARGSDGLKALAQTGQSHVRTFLTAVLDLQGIALCFPQAAFFNECVLSLDLEKVGSVKGFIEQAALQGIHVGVDMTTRVGAGQKGALKLSFSEVHSQEDLERLITFFKLYFPKVKPQKITFPLIPTSLLRTERPNIPHYPEETLQMYYETLGTLNIGPEETCYPLGSCTMKYNPYINDWAATLPGFTDLHPQAPIEDCQGSLEILYEIQKWFQQITGLAAVTTQVVAGAQGELVGLKLFQAYQKDRGQEHRKKLLIPRSAHGTNFATATVAGLDPSDILYIDSGENGQIKWGQFQAILTEHRDSILGVMITNPNTAGIFEERFYEIAKAVHAAGGLVYMDGANMNALAGWVDLGKLGVDAVHNNLHKTWSIPHGGGGPGDAIVAVSDRLKDYLPGAQIVFAHGRYQVKTAPKTIGVFHRHWGNFAHKVRCYSYLLRLGAPGIRRMSAVAVLSARYLLQQLIGQDHFDLLPKGAEKIPRMHEFIITLKADLWAFLEQRGLQKNTVIPSFGKLFLDFGYHAPTVAFPEPLGLMLEPTESYTKTQLERLALAIIQMKENILENPQCLERAPKYMPVKRVNEVEANRNLILSEPIENLPPIKRGSNPMH